MSTKKTTWPAFPHTGDLDLAAQNLVKQIKSQNLQLPVRFVDSNEKAYIEVSREYSSRGVIKVTVTVEED